METNRFLVLLAAIWFQKPAFEWVWKLRFFGVEGMERGLQPSQLIGLILEF